MTRIEEQFDPLGLDGLGGSSVKKPASPESRSEPTSERGETAPARVDAGQQEKLIERLRIFNRWRRGEDSGDGYSHPKEIGELIDSSADSLESDAKRIAELEADVRHLRQSCANYKRENDIAVAKLLSAQATIGRMRELGNAVLDTRDAEAKMAMSMENMTANFHRGCAKADEQRYLNTLVAASNAEKALRDALSFPVDTSALDELRRDAERYQYLRLKLRVCPSGLLAVSETYLPNPECACLYESALDSAIDLAIAKKGEGK